MEEIECGKEKKQKGGERGRKRKGKEIDRMGRPDEGTNSLDRCIVQWKGISQEQAELPSIPFRERIYICVFVQRIIGEVFLARAYRSLPFLVCVVRGLIHVD